VAADPDDVGPHVVEATKGGLMETTYDIVDRTGWPPGEWDSEPDRATWVHDETGARCTLRRGPLGHWCGYVGLRANHPLAGKVYNEIDGVSQELTFGSYCTPMAEDEWIRYRLNREKWITESLLYPVGDAARHLREDRKGDTSTLAGWQEWIRQFNLCHDDCPHGLWWLGFDFAHAFDVMPGMLAHFRERRIAFPDDGPFRTTYKNIQWAVDATDRLAMELFDEKVLNQGERPCS
jgi:hypothetical protein